MRGIRGKEFSCGEGKLGEGMYKAESLVVSVRRHVGEILGKKVGVVS